MNSLDDVARLRPPTPDRSVDELDAIWARSTMGLGDDGFEDAEQLASTPTGRRRGALAAAAVLLAAGVLAIALIPNRGAPSFFELAVPSPAVTVDERPGPVESVQTASPTVPGASPAPAADGVPATTALVIGDSVVLGAAGELVEAGFTVDAVESRSFSGGVELVRSLAEREALGDLVVISLGTNGSVSEQEVDEMMRLLVGVDRVVIVTNRIDRQWADANNALFRSRALESPEVSLMDWDVLGDECPGDCFWSDGFHLRPAGARYFVDRLVAVTGG